MKEKLVALLRELESVDAGMMAEARACADIQLVKVLISGATAFAVCADYIRQIVESEQ